MPILNQGHLVGVLYLENRCTAGIFNSERMVVLNFLCTQAAISLQNAQLYQNVHQALQEVHLKEKQYQNIFEAVSDGLAITELGTGKLLAANPAYYQLHGYTYDEIIKINPFECIQPEKHAKFLEFLTVVRAQQEFNCSARCFTSEGHPFDVEIRSVPFLYNGQPCALSVMRDITAQKQMEESIQEKNRRLEQAMHDLQSTQLQMVQSEKMASLGNLVAGVAHEINNPIGFLNGSIRNAKDYVQDLFAYLALYQQHHPNAAAPVQDKAEDIDLEFLTEDLPKLLNSMQGATERIRSISTSLRTFSRADTEHKVSTDLHEGIDSTLLILKYRLKANEFRPAIQVIKEYGDLLPIECFPGQLNQVFMNILANAIDTFDEIAQTRTFVELEAHPQKIWIRTTQSANHAQIEIQDNGQGMTEEVKARIFDHLFTTKGVGKGTGLGLAIAQQIVVEKHGGTIEVDSTPGEGTTFVIHLPIKKT